MTFTERRQALRAILHGNVCVRPASVHDAVSVRIAEDLGFELGMLGGSTASLAVLGDPDLILITLTELADTVRRITRAGGLPLLVDADHGYGNALNVQRTVQELDGVGAAGLSIEDTLLPQPFGEAKQQLISLEEGAGKIRAAVSARGDTGPLIFARTGAPAVTGVDDAIARAQAYEATGADALFFTGIKTRAELSAMTAATRLPIMLGNVDGELDDSAFLATQRVRIAGQGHLPFAAAALAIHNTLKALRDGVSPKNVSNLPSPDFVDRYMRASTMQQHVNDFLRGMR